MIITKDQDWMSVLDKVATNNFSVSQFIDNIWKSDLVLPSGEELYQRITNAENFRIVINTSGD